jgi:rhamnogalacturonan acetylesterase
MKTRNRIKGIVAAFAGMLSLAGAAAANPTLWLIGDSTVQVDTPGQQGWGTPLPQFFDLSKIRIKNQAVGGRSSRTFISEGLWEKVRKQLKPGDYLMMQFGHNDASPINEDPPVTKATRARGTIRSNGEETVEIVNVMTGKPETVHSYGWYIRKMADEAKTAGVKVIIVSPIPKRGFITGKARRDGDGYSELAKQAAARSGASFLDLSTIVADKHDVMGEAAATALFDDSVHTTPDGAKFNAQCVVEGLSALPDCEIKKYLASGKQH